ncbi:hypothetical protein HDV57DRAFT_490413, partial [Trichoderma longibrachiatum]
MSFFYPLSFVPNIGPRPVPRLSLSATSTHTTPREPSPPDAAFTPLFNLTTKHSRRRKHPARHISRHYKKPFKANRLQSILQRSESFNLYRPDQQTGN